MKPIDLYNSKPIKVSNRIYELHRHMPGELDDIDDIEDKRIELRYYADEYIDGIRGWTIFSVWFDESPVMICQEAGRDNRDHIYQYITDRAKYIEFIQYLYSLHDHTKYMDEDEFYDPEKEAEHLTSFYGGNLYGYDDSLS